MKPLSQLSKEKLNARKRYWGFCTSIQEEFSKQFIHQGLSLREVSKSTMLSPATVERFFANGHPLGGKKKKPKPYSWMHGPYATTLFAISDALGFEFKAIRRK